MRFGISWIDILRVTEPVFGCAVIFGVESNDAEIIKCAFVLPVEIQNCLVKWLRGSRIILGEAQIAKREKRLRIFRHIGIGDRKFLFRQRQVVRFERLPAGIVSIERPERRISLWPGDKDGRTDQQREINGDGVQLACDEALP